MNAEKPENEPVENAGDAFPAATPPVPSVFPPSLRLLPALQPVLPEAAQLQTIDGSYPRAVAAALEQHVLPSLRREARYVGRRYSSKNREDNEDELVAEAFILLWDEKTRPFNPTRWPLASQYWQYLIQRAFDHLRGMETVRVTVTRPEPNGSGSHLTRVRVPRFNSLPQGFDRPGEQDTPSEALAIRSIEDLIRELHCNDLVLSKREQDILEGFYFLGLSSAELSKRLGLDVGALYQAHYRLLKRLQPVLGDLDNGE